MASRSYHCEVREGGPRAVCILTLSGSSWLLMFQANLDGLGMFLLFSLVSWSWALESLPENAG